MVACYIRDLIDSEKLAEFESYAKLWIPLVNRLGGTHHGYFLPHEGASNIELASFSFPSLAACEQYRIEAAANPECQAAVAFSRRSRCFLSADRTSFPPVFD